MSTSISVGVGDLPCFPTFFSLIKLKIFNFSLNLFQIKTKLFCSTRSVLRYHVILMPQGDKDKNDQISGQKWP